ncbi:DUF4112 domain-containing protein [Salinibacter altiplanensis]|uniref:DUF4112 domain-containing protein n=1 Tax=Salinibacter altiplanensis TaxID=1803181 RepID=UPI000C9F74F9|nr:DUF4112 domain-containing protein [Salinibacter altiplanensis]
MTTDSSAQNLGTPGATPLTKRLDRFAYWSDDCIPLPGLGARIGLDPVVGLVPVWGDIITAAVSCYVPYEAYRVGAPPSLLFKMLVVIAVDALSGFIPVAGDLIDAVFKANKVNVQMLKNHLGA